MFSTLLPSPASTVCIPTLLSHLTYFKPGEKGKVSRSQRRLLRVDAPLGRVGLGPGSMGDVGSPSGTPETPGIFGVRILLALMNSSKIFSYGFSVPI